MNTESKIGIFLCECGGKISSRIDLPQVCEQLRYESWDHLGVYPYPCLAPGIAAMRQEVEAKGLNRILVAGCSSRVMKKRFPNALASVGVEKYQVEMVNLKDHVAAVHEGTPQELARKAAALIAGSIANLKLLEPYEPVPLNFEGPALILGGGISGFAAARELAHQGMECVLFSRALTPERVLDELYRTFPGCRLFCGELGELFREVFAHPLIKVMPDQPIDYIIGGVGDYRVGFKGPDATVTEVAGSAIITALDREFAGADTDYLGGGERVCDLLDLEERLIEGDDSDFKPGKMLFWINSPEHGQAAQEMATVAAWRDSLVLAREHPQVKSTVLYPANVRLPLTGADLVEARAHGIGLQSYAPEVHPVVLSGYLTYVNPSDHLEHELAWDNLVVSAVPGEPVAKSQELLRWLPIYPENGGALKKSHVKFWPDQVPDESLFFTGSAGGLCDLNEVLQQGKKAARGVLRLREKALEGRLVSPVVVQVDKDLCEGCGLCTEICPCGGIEHVKPGSVALPREADNHLCTGGGTCAATCPYEAVRVLNNTAQQLEARIKALLGRMQADEVLGFVCGWGGLASAEQAAVKGLTYNKGIYLIPVNCLGSLDPFILSKAFLSGAKSIMLAGCTPTHSCHYAYGVDHCWHRVNVVKKLLSLAGLERRRLAMGYVEVNEPESFVSMVESHMDGMEKLPPLPQDDKTKARLWAIHATLHRPRVRWVLGTSLRRPTEKEFPGSQFNAVDADDTMLDVLREEFLAARIIKALGDQLLNPPGIARIMEEPVKNITPLLPDMASEGRITLKSWEGGYPIYAVGKA
ncbi:MAG: hydrogenase iron-sulfur subunit [Deltaproteobacteria bacterium]|nr:hydrogenase iron-sulfur subunit [Deltaproteobacteria bacterium]